jgi:gp16 family phage-associated protein
MKTMTKDQVKQKFRREGRTFTGWANENGYKPHQVIRVLNGFDKGNFGRAHEIAVKLGLKPATEPNPELGRN